MLFSIGLHELDDGNAPSLLAPQNDVGTCPLSMYSCVVCVVLLYFILQFLQMDSYSFCTALAQEYLQASLLEGHHASTIRYMQ